MRLLRVLRIVLVFGALFFGPAVTRATQLTFEQIRSGGIVYSAFNDGVVPQDYGDRVTGLTQNVLGGVFTYGNLGEGFTPNVQVSYGPYPESASVWFDGFGDLTHVLWTNVFLPFEITLSADPGYLVNLHGFDLSGWWHWDYIIASMQVLDGNGNFLINQSNVYLEGDNDGPPHSHFEFGTLQAETLVLRFDTRNLNTYFFNVGLDNLRFSQSLAAPNQAPAETPEPGAWFLLMIGFAAARMLLLYLR